MRKIPAIADYLASAMIDAQPDPESDPGSAIPVNYLSVTQLEVPADVLSVPQSGVPADIESVLESVPDCQAAWPMLQLPASIVSGSQLHLSPDCQVHLLTCLIF